LTETKLNLREIFEDSLVKMGKKSKKNKKNKNKEVIEYDAATQHILHVGQRSPTHELHESDYHKLDDNIDEKEKARLRR